MHSTIFLKTLTHCLANTIQHHQVCICAVRVIIQEQSKKCPFVVKGVRQLPPCTTDVSSPEHSTQLPERNDVIGSTTIDHLVWHVPTMEAFRSELIGEGDHV